MFQVVPEPEFSAWFEALPEPLAEEVATAIDLAATASAGTKDRPQRCRDFPERPIPGCAISGWLEDDFKLGERTG